MSLNGFFKVLSFLLIIFNESGLILLMSVSLNAWHEVSLIVRSNDSFKVLLFVEGGRKCGFAKTKVVAEPLRLIMHHGFESFVIYTEHVIEYTVSILHIISQLRVKTTFGRIYISDAHFSLSILW